jgi:hypothetical protein
MKNKITTLFNMFDCIVPFTNTNHSIARATGLMHNEKRTPLLVHVDHLFKPTTEEDMTNIWSWVKAFRDSDGYALSTVNDDEQKEYYFCWNQSLNAEHDIIGHEDKCRTLLMVCYELCKAHDIHSIFFPEELHIDPVVKSMLGGLGIEVYPLAQIENPEYQIKKWSNEDCILLHDSIQQFDLDNDEHQDPLGDYEYIEQDDDSDETNIRKLNDLVKHLSETGIGFKYDPSFEVIRHLVGVLSDEYDSDCDYSEDTLSRTSVEFIPTKKWTNRADDETECDSGSDSDEESDDLLGSMDEEEDCLSQSHDWDYYQMTNEFESSA